MKILHRNHLHVSPFQISVQFALIGFHNCDIVGLETELSTTYMVAQRSRIDGVGPLFFWVLKCETFSASTHLCKLTSSRFLLKLKIEVA